MIAVIIFAAVSAAGVTVLSGYAAGTRAIANSDDFSMALSKFHSVLSDDMAHFVPRPVRGVDGGREAPFDVNGLDPEILFHIVRLAPVAVPDASETVEGISLVEYRYKDGTLFRRVYDHADRLRVTGFVDETLVQGVEKLELRYQKNTVWLSEWLPVATASDAPDLVELSMSFAGKGKLTSTYKLNGGAV